MSRICLLSFLMLISSGVLQSAVSTDRCTQEFGSIIQAVDVDAMAYAWNNRPSNDACSLDELANVQLEFTKQVALQAQQILVDTDDPDRASAWLDQFSSLELGLPLAENWQLNYVRGLIAVERHKRNRSLGDENRAKLYLKEAAEQYEIAYARALGSNTQMQGVTEPDSEKTQQHLYLLATEMRHLYGDLGSAISRSGEPVAATLGSRGIQTRRKPLPVEFEFNKAEITSSGFDNIALIVAYIDNQGIKSIDVTGHTDWRGDAAYNKDLSIRRAQAVADAIEKQYRNKYDGSLSIEVIGRGEECPRRVSQLEQYTAEDLAALYRRVSLGYSHQTNSRLSECDTNGIRSDREARERLAEMNQ